MILRLENCCSIVPKTAWGSNFFGDLGQQQHETEPFVPKIMLGRQLTQMI